MKKVKVVVQSCIAYQLTQKYEQKMDEDLSKYCFQSFLL